MADILPARKKASYYIQRISGFILLLVLAGVFFFSAYTKIATQSAFDSFQWTFLDLGISSTLFAGVLARLMIGFECMLGLFLLFHIFLKKFTYPAVIGLLLVFIVYLLMVIANQGNSGNCGCFGDTVVMKPSAAIWKNVAMICTTLLLMYIYPVKPYKHQEWIVVIIGMAALVTPYILNLPSNGEPTVVSQKIDLAPLYSGDPKAPDELKSGKHIIAFMSLTCPHCRKAAYLLQVIHRHHPDIPLFFILNGAHEQEADFFKETHAQDVPHMIFNNRKAFAAMAGSGVPAIFWVNDSTIERKANYYQLDPNVMEKWLHK